MARSNFKSIKYGAVFWGLVLVLTAVTLILDGIGIKFGFGITPWRIIAGIMLLAWFIYEIVRLRFTEIFFPLAFLFIVFQGPLSEALKTESSTIISPWIVLLAALLLTVGFKMIFKPKHAININGKEIPLSDAKQSDGKIGTDILYIDTAELSNATIREHLGTVEVYISNREAYTGGGVITVCENLGVVTLHIPNEWNVVTKISENLGKVNIPDHDATEAKSILLVITENLGQINVVFD